jgi:hypothetical protein
MAAYFAGTLTAFRKGITKMPVAAAIKNIEAWEERLQEVELTGCRAILRDLAALKKQLQEDEPDGERIRHLMAKLASQTIAISEKADPRHGEKIANLGETLAEAAEAAESDDVQPTEKRSDSTKSKAGDDDHESDGKFARGNQAGRSSQSADSSRDDADDTGAGGEGGRKAKGDTERSSKSDGDGREARAQSRSR